MNSFLLFQALLLTMLFCIYYTSGKLVQVYGLKVNYTRKINHFALFTLPFLLEYLLDYQKTTTTRSIGLFLSVISIAILWKPLRSRSSFLNTVFVSIDRPEDRPHTLLWLITQTLAAAVVIVPMLAYFSSINKAALTLIPVLINGFGDGLAEPVGVRFGRFKYKVRALFSNTIYHRSLEGSMCVFISGVVSILLFKSMFTDFQFIAALVLIPILTTLAEAFSPHTWDTPFIYAVSGLSLIGIFYAF